MSLSNSLVIETHALTKAFRHVTAVDRMSLSIKSGEVVALLGSNGSGKSTTFRLLLNIYQPTDGWAKILGRLSSDLDGKDFDKIGFVSESQKLPQWMNVQTYHDYCKSFYSEWDDGLYEDLKKAFRIPEKQPIKQLSRGQKMKAAVMSILPARPKLLMLDEPFSGLDVETRAQLSALLRKLAHEDGLTTILTTHDVEEVEPVASRLIILQEGQIHFDEPLEAYLLRHRLIVFKKSDFETLPENPLHSYKQKEEGEQVLCYVDNFDPDLENKLRASVSDAQAVEVRKLNLREILTSRAVSF